jgi:hypothetical protein
LINPYSWGVFAGDSSPASEEPDLTHRLFRHPAEILKRSPVAILKAPFEGANGFGMASRFFGPLGGGAILQENHRANNLITPLQMKGVFDAAMTASYSSRHLVVKNDIALAIRIARSRRNSLE